MPDDWEDEDDWEAADLSLPQQGNEEVWSDEEAHHAEPEPLHAPSAPKPAPPKEKTGLEKKIEEREKREAEEAARLAALREAAGVTTEIDPSLTGEAAERARRKLLEEAADFDNAASAFGLDVATENAAAPAPAAKAAATPKSAPEPAPKPAVSKPPPEAVRPDPKVDLPDDFLAKTDKDFDKLASDLDSRIRPYAGKTGHMKLIKALLRKTGEVLTTEDAKELSTFVSIMYNDKVKADREKDKKPKKGKKGGIKIAAGKDVDNDFGGLEGDGGGAGWRANDDFDFM